MLFATYALMFAAFSTRLFMQGFYDYRAFAVEVVVKTLFMTMKIELFVVLAKWTL